MAKRISKPSTGPPVDSDDVRELIGEVCALRDAIDDLRVAVDYLTKELPVCAAGAVERSQYTAD